MKNCLSVFFSFMVFAVSATAQSETVKLHIGDPAPPVKVSKWIKGTPVTEFQKGKVYVVEFWATWCLPCIAGMPHLSKIAKQYKDDATITGISILERANTSPAQIDSFVHSMGPKMDYNVGREDSNYMAESWLRAAGERGIPFAYIIDRQGRIAWMGHPKKLDHVLPKVVNQSWNIAGAVAEMNEQQSIQALDNKAWERLNRFMGNPGKPDSALLEIEKMIREEPKLKFAPRVGHYTFWSLIKTDQDKAAVYGRELFQTEVYDDPPYKSITDAVSYMLEIVKTDLRKSLLILGADAYQAQLDNYPWSMNIPVTYAKIADLYFRARLKQKAIAAQGKAIEAAKNKEDFPVDKMKALLLDMKRYTDL